MAVLADSMEPISVNEVELKQWGELWLADQVPPMGARKKPNYFTKYQAVNFALFIDRTFSNTLARMLGGIPVVDPIKDALQSPLPDCVECGAVKIIGGIRPQNFDAAYRPDGPRIVFDSKALNHILSVGKNWQNMINDLGTEAATVHTRFPYAVVAFMVIIPRPALRDRQETDIIRTLERLATRTDVLDQTHLAEVISLIVWDPTTGKVLEDCPPQTSILRIEKFSDQLFPKYVERYKGLPPHNVTSAGGGRRAADEDED